MYIPHVSLHKTIAHHASHTVPRFPFPYRNGAGRQPSTPSRHLERKQRVGGIFNRDIHWVFEHDVIGNQPRPRTNMYAIRKTCRFHDALFSPFRFLSLTGVVKVRKLYGGGVTDQYYIYRIAVLTKVSAGAFLDRFYCGLGNGVLSSSERVH